MWNNLVETYFQAEPKINGSVSVESEASSRCSKKKKKNGVIENKSIYLGSD